MLPVGSYRLCVAGKTQAAQSIPFEIRAGVTAKVDLRLRVGVRQQFDISLPAAVESEWGSLRILQNGSPLANASARRVAGKPCTAEACLAPGDYTVAAKFGAFEGAASFTVGEQEAAPVPIALAPATK